jgi:hypothetical protein
MSDHRSLDVVLAEWRALEQRLLAEGDEDIAAELAALRDEYARAIADRRSDAQELGRAPSFNPERAAS